MSEAELAIEEKLRKKRQEEKQAWAEYLELRAKQRAKEEEELRKLKERQARRKAQRAEDEKFMQQMRRKQEEQRHQELEERKQKEAEAKRLRLEEAEKKRLAMQQAIKQRDEAARRNFIVKKTSPASLEGHAGHGGHGPTVFGMQDVMKTKEQLAEDKKIAMSFRIKPLKLDGLQGAELKRTVNELWDTIIQLESDKYDLEEEQKRQEYHLKELTERQKQINKNKALKMGLDIEELSGVHPPKVRLASKYERRIDRRTFGEKTELFNGGYVQVIKKITDEEWKKKVDEYLETHGDKHVPKWDPSAPRKDVVEPGKGKIYESDDSDDEATGALADKLRGYMEQQDQAEARNSDSRKSSVAQPPDQDRARRRSSQISQASSTGSSSRQPQPANKQKQQAPPPPPPEEDEYEEEEEEEEEEEQEEEDEEEYEEEEEDE